MRSVQLREAKATLSALIEAAERGSPTTITKHGQAAAVIVPVDVAEAIYAGTTVNFGDLLMTFPGDLDFEPLHGAMREIEL
jgi:prevent-host-death family protein